MRRIEEEMITESEAKKKWCPMARVVAAGHSSGNTFTDGKSVDYVKCIGSACMAWQFAMDKDNPHVGTGYCGAFRRPE